MLILLSEAAWLGLGSGWERDVRRLIEPGRIIIGAPKKAIR